MKRKQTAAFIVALVSLFSFISAYATAPDAVGAEDALPALTETVDTGDIISFGRYEQDNNPDNGEEAIEWLVLDIADEKCLLLSYYGLEGKRYNDSFEDVTWEECSLRKWLNEDFLNCAFSDTERGAILRTAVDNSQQQGNSDWNAIGGNNTDDCVFILSCAEANHYLEVASGNENNTRARVAPTLYAYAHGAGGSTVDKTADGDLAGVWWLRSPGDYQYIAACVYTNGALSGCIIGNTIGIVRPALWVNLDAVSMEDITVTKRTTIRKTPAAEGSVVHSIPDDKANQNDFLIEEKVRDFIANCYRTALGRKGSDSEIDSWTSQVMNEAKYDDRETAVRRAAFMILLSDEFRGRELSREEIARILYLVCLQREPEKAGLENWVVQMNSLELQGAVMSFINSREFEMYIDTMSIP